jgi:hypothetical protein
MSFDPVRTSLYDYVKANFAGWPLALENYQYKPVPGTVWVRFGVHPNVQQSEEVGGTWERMEGIAWFQIFLPENSGTAAAYQVGDAIKLMLFEKHIVVAGKPTVMCRAAPLHYVGNDGSGWEQWNVSVPYLAFAQVGP